MGFHSLTNTSYFSETGRAWFKNGGRYTLAPQGSRDYREFWEEEERRCKYGYKVGDLWIPGRYYGYLNFFPMSRVPDATLNKMIAEKRDKRGKLSVNTAEKIIGFPKFWEIDYEWWNFKYISWSGGDFMGIHSDGGEHLACLKTRGAGFSYKEAWDGIYNYNFIHGSKSYYFAGAEPYLVGDAIMDKVQSGLDWINDYCPPWKQNRQKKYTLMHQKASYIDAKGTERGINSEIIAQIVDKAGKTRGKRGRKATFEEAGTFPVLEDALEVCLGSMREGTVYVGQVTVFGTGGEVGPAVQGLENIFTNPKAWDMMVFNNIWEDGMYGTECGYFVPCWRANSFFMDEEGNVDMEGAIIADNKERDKKASSGKPKDLDRRKAEYPRTPSEALQRLTGNGFNIAEIDAQIKRIEKSTFIRELLRYGDLTRCDKNDPSGFNGVKLRVKPKHIARPIEDFPHKQSDNLEGCVTIAQKPFTMPFKGVDTTPEGMYFITFDAYYKEETQDKTSLFSIKVWKQHNLFDDSFAGLPVAWYAGRPMNSTRCHEILFMLADMYNGKIQGEIAGGGQAVVTYAKQHRKLHRLCNEPEMIHNKEMASKAAGLSYLMNLAADRKKVGIIYLEDWHMTPRSIREDGSLVYTIHHVYDIAFLREMKKMDPEKMKQGKGNYDRISDAIVAMFMLKENDARVVQERMERVHSGFYSRDHILFSADDDSEGTISYSGTYDTGAGGVVELY